MLTLFAVQVFVGETKTIVAKNLHRSLGFLNPAPPAKRNWRPRNALRRPLPAVLVEGTANIRWRGASYESSDSTIRKFAQIVERILVKNVRHDIPKKKISRTRGLPYAKIAGLAGA